jgi:hypothetical protein
MQGVAPPSHPLILLMLWNRWARFLDKMRQLRVDQGFIIIQKVKDAAYLVSQWQRNSPLCMNTLPKERAMIILWDEK